MHQHTLSAALFKKCTKNPLKVRLEYAGTFMETVVAPWGPKPPYTVMIIQRISFIFIYFCSVILILIFLRYQRKHGDTFKTLRHL